MAAGILHSMAKMDTKIVRSSQLLIIAFTAFSINGCSVSDRKAVPSESLLSATTTQKPNQAPPGRDGSCAEKWCAAKASFYGEKDGFAGKKTASGERFDPKKITAAHRTLPFGTRVRVRNPDNGKEIVVEINDRGPHAKGRDFDLSFQAARELGIVKDGVADLQYIVQN